jgi:hypothetical protein
MFFRYVHVLRTSAMNVARSEVPALSEDVEGGVGNNPTGMMSSSRVRVFVASSKSVSDKR